MKTIIRVYRRNGWRWQMRDARNGRIIGASDILRERATKVAIDGRAHDAAGDVHDPLHQARR